MPEWVPEWLFEGQLTVYAVLAVSLVFMLVIWKQTPRKAYVWCSVVLAVLIGLYFLMDLLVETDREQITHAVQEMSAGVQARNVEQIFAQVSDSYNRHGSNKAGFKSAVSGVITGQHVDRVALWAFEFARDYKQKDSPSLERSNVAKVAFMAKPEGPGGASLYRVDAVMHRDADGKWRMQSWEASDAFHEGSTAIRVPYLD
jgi:hypothetical protein